MRLLKSGFAAFQQSKHPGEFFAGVLPYQYYIFVYGAASVIAVVDDALRLFLTAGKRALR